MIHSRNPIPLQAIKAKPQGKSRLLRANNSFKPSPLRGLGAGSYDWAIAAAATLPGLTQALAGTRMDSRQIKQNELLQTILGEACAELPQDTTIKGQIAAQEFPAALASLIQVGDRHQVTPTFWWNLKKAAELLNLEHLYAPLRQRRLSVERAS